MLLKTNNVWGRSVDGQRTDLWVVRIGDSPGGAAGGPQTLLDAIRSQLGARAADLSRDDLELYPLSVAFPETAMNTENYRQGNALVAMPSAEQELRGVRMVFRIEIPKRKRTLPTFVNLLQCWRDLPRMGRGLTTGGAAIPDLPTPEAQPIFRFNVTIDFMSGAVKVAPDKVFSDTGLLNQLPYQNSFSVMLRKAWCASVLIGPDISYAETRHMEITAQLYAEYLDGVPSAFDSDTDSNIDYIPLKQ